MRLVTCVAVALVGAAAVALWMPGGAGADPEVAKFLLTEAKKAISVRAYADAVVKLRRVQEEDPKQIEALYLLGKVFEKQKEPGQALGAYRAYRDACRALGDDLDRSDARLLSLALRRIGVLGKGEAELDKLQATFAKEVVAFARLNQQRDPDIALDALRRLLEVKPDEGEAKELLAKLGGTADVEAAGMDPQHVPIPGITHWVDLLADRSIPPGGKTSYERKVLTFDEEGGSIFWTDPALHAPDVYVYDMEFRFLKEYAHGYLLGPAFAQDEQAASGTEVVMAFAQKSLVTLNHASGGKNIELAQTAVSALGMDTWHRLTVAVEGRKVYVYFDGKRVLSSSVPGRKSLAGTVGIFHQRCAAEVRTLRLGTKE